MSHAIGLQEFDDGWLPIETAPKDGTYILIYSQETNEFFVGFWLKWYGWQLNCSKDICYGIKDPTHWMPLPQPPGGD